jgi:carboxymethylenebutenolidase
MELLMKFLRLFLLSPIFLGAATLSFPAGAPRGEFVNVQQADGTTLRSFVAGPEDARAGVLVVHDYFGISDATREAVERLGSLGYRAMAVDLYGGKSASRHEEAVKLMQSLDRRAADRVLQAGLDQLKRPGRKIATLGFSMGGQESLLANLNDPDAVSATAIVYGFGFEKLDTARLEKLKGPVLVISGSEDTGAVQAASGFLANMKTANRQCEMFIYPGVDHGYAQPLFNGGKNFSPEAVRASWVVIDDFLESHLRR